VFNTVGLAVELLFIVLLHEQPDKKLFPSGIRPAQKPKKGVKNRWCGVSVWPQFFYLGLFWPVSILMIGSLAGF